MASPRLFDLGADLYTAYTDNPAWRASCAALAKHLSPSAQRILDLGCGPGTTIAALAAELPETEWVGGDLARRMLLQARRRLARQGIAAHLLRCNALTLPLASASVDGVVGHSFLYLVPDAAKVLRAAYRVVRPGGRVAFMEPAEGYLSPASIWRVSADPRFLLSIPPWRVMSRCQRRYSAESFIAVLHGAGFEEIRCEPVLGGLGIIGSGRRSAGG